jgi:hypothetical protein
MAEQSWHKSGPMQNGGAILAQITKFNSKNVSNGSGVFI